MLKVDSTESIALTAIADKQDEPENTAAISKFKQIALIKFDDMNDQQLLPNYLSNISDQVKVGFYSCDRCTQTEESDIIAISQATHNLIYLCKEIDVVKYDLNFAKTSFQNRFDLELHNKSIEIYSLINQKFTEMKKQHEQNIDRIRKAYKTQLANAIVKITNLAEAKYASQMPENARVDKEDFKVQALMQRIKELQRVIGEKEIEMKSAKDKSEELIERLIPNETNTASSTRIAAAASASFNNNNNHQTTNDNNDDNEEVVKGLTEERDNAIHEVNSLYRKIGRMEEALTLKEEETERLSNEIGQLELQLETQKNIAEEVTKEFQEFKSVAETEKKQLKKDFEKQKKDLEQKMQDKIKETREQVVNAAKEEMRQQQLEQEKQRQLLEEKQRQQEKKLIEQQKRAEESYKKNLEQQKHQQEKLLEKAKQEKEKELERLHREKEKEKEKEKREQQKDQKDQKEPDQTSQPHAANDATVAESSTHLPHPAKVSRKEDLDLILKLKTNEQFYKVEVARLHKEINRNNETWEKRFDILKHSLHAIKDEMYLRQNLQKQSVQLAYASIAYTMDEAPLSSQQQQQQTYTSQSIRTDINPTEMKITKPVLPSIGKNIDRQASSHTTSMPSRLSIQLENDEAQIIDDDEMKKFKEEYLSDVDYIIAK